MIERDQLVKIGKFNKAHGIKGEISFTFTDDSFESADNPFLICDIDGLFVPFKLEEYRFTSDTTALVKLKNINSDKNVQALVNKEVYFPKKDIMPQEASGNNYTWDYFLGYTLIDRTAGEIGRVSAVDDSTINTLFIVEKEGGELMIPANEKIIEHIDEEHKKILIELPEGLLEI